MTDGMYTWMGPLVLNFKMGKMDLTIKPHMGDGRMDGPPTTQIEQSKF